MARDHAISGGDSACFLIMLELQFIDDLVNLPA